MILALALIVMLNADVSFAQQYGSIRGTILTDNNEPLSNARVCFYNVNSGPSPYKYWRVCKRMVRTENDGSFEENVLPGKYYILATKKTTGEKPGPPVEIGDLIWPPLDGRQLKLYHVTEEGPTDIGTVTGAVQFREQWLPARESAIEGRVLLKNGTPAEGVIVYASSDPEMKDVVFISDERTGQDGKFIVRVDEDGIYYVSVKGARKSVEKTTVYRGETTEGIDIRVSKNPGKRWEKKSDKKNDVNQ